MRNRRITVLSIAFLMLTAVACASPPERPAKLWVSTGGQLENFGSDERYCLDHATEEEGAALDDQLFAVCMFTKGWRVSGEAKPRIEEPKQEIASVAPRAGLRSKVNVRTRPSTDSRVLTALASDDRAQLLGRDGDWFHVRLVSGEQGYVSARWTRRVN